MVQRGSVSFEKKSYGTRPLMSFPISKKVNQKFVKEPSSKLLAIPVMYTTCSILGLATFDIIRQYTDINFPIRAPNLPRPKQSIVEAGIEKYQRRNDTLKMSKNDSPYYSSSSESDRTSSVTCPLLFNCLIIIKHMSFPQYTWNTSNVRSIVLEI